MTKEQVEKRIEKRLGELITERQRLLEQANATLQQLNGAIAALEELIAPEPQEQPQGGDK